MRSRDQMRLITIQKRVACRELKPVGSAVLRSLGARAVQQLRVSGPRMMVAERLASKTQASWELMRRRRCSFLRLAWLGCPKP